MSEIYPTRWYIISSSGESPRKLRASLNGMDYPDLVLLELDFDTPLDSPSDEGSIDLMTLLERSA